MTETAPEQDYDGTLVAIDAEAVSLKGVLYIPQNAQGTVVLPWGPGNGPDEASHRNFASLARPLNQHGLATLIVDLFTQEENALDTLTGYFRDNSDIMQQRLNGIADWLLESERTQNLAVGLLGTGIVGAAALLAAVERPDAIDALVTIEAPFKVVQDAIKSLSSPTLLIAARNGEEMFQALPLTEERKRLENLDAEPPLLGSQKELQRISTAASSWFAHWLVPIQ